MLASVVRDIWTFVSPLHWRYPRPKKTGWEIKGFTYGTILLGISLPPLLLCDFFLASPITFFPCFGPPRTVFPAPVLRSCGGTVGNDSRATCSRGRHGRARVLDRRSWPGMRRARLARVRSTSCPGEAGTGMEWNGYDRLLHRAELEKEWKLSRTRQAGTRLLETLFDVREICMRSDVGQSQSNNKSKQQEVRCTKILG